MNAILVASAAVAAEGPCDITGAAGNPCVAAHSTVRALYGAYSGGLYIVQKNHTQEQLTVGVLEPGGFADKAKHDAFCGPAQDCVILSVLDQSPMANHLTQRHGLVNASRSAATAPTPSASTACGSTRATATTPTTPGASRRGTSPRASTR